MTALVALILGAVQTLTTAVTVAIGLTATTAVIVPGTGTPHPQDVTIYMENAVSRYLDSGGDPLAVANPAAGFAYVRGTILAPDGDDEPPPDAPYGYEPGEVEALIAAAVEQCDAVHYCQQVEGSDTMYITLPARYLAWYQSVLDLAEAAGTSALVILVVDFVSPFAQTLIETAYTRDDYTKPSPVTLLPHFNPIQVAADLVQDIPEGIDMALTPGHTGRRLCRLRPR